MNYEQFHALLLNAYEQAIHLSEDQTNNIDHENIYCDGGQNYPCFFTFGKIYLDSDSDGGLILPTFGFACDEADEISLGEVMYLRSKNIRCLNEKIINIDDTNEATKSLEEWEEIFFNAPMYELYLEKQDYSCIYPDAGDLLIHQQLKELNDGFYGIKSIAQLSKEMPSLLCKAYDLLETVSK